MQIAKRPTERQVLNIIGVTLDKPYIINYKQDLSKEDDNILYLGHFKVFDAADKLTVIEAATFAEQNLLTLQGSVRINKAYSGKLTSSIQLKDNALNSHIKKIEKYFKRLQIIHKDSQGYKLECQFKIIHNPSTDITTYIDLKVVNENGVDIKAITDKKMFELGYSKSYEKTSLRDLRTVQNMIDI